MWGLFKWIYKPLLSVWRRIPQHKPISWITCTQEVKHAWIRPCSVNVLWRSSSMHILCVTNTTQVYFEQIFWHRIFISVPRLSVTCWWDGLPTEMLYFEILLQTIYWERFLSIFHYKMQARKCLCRAILDETVSLACVTCTLIWQVLRPI